MMGQMARMLERAAESVLKLVIPGSVVEGCASSHLRGHPLRYQILGNTPCRSRNNCRRCNAAPASSRVAKDRHIVERAIAIASHRGSSYSM